jgi:hypothetical protein
MAKQPRTVHLDSSGRAASTGAAFRAVAGRHLVVEEKVDDSHLSLAFKDGQLTFAHRGNPLSGEREFAPVQAWAYSVLPELQRALGERYELHGGSLYAKHTVFYDALPHYFLEYDVYDQEEGCWLSTPRRRELLTGVPVHSVAVLHEGALDSLAALTALLGPSHYKSPAWREALAAAHGAGDTQETDDSDYGEGLYVKIEEEGRVVARYKWVRPGFLNTLLDSGSHWRARPLVANRLRS